MMPARSVGTTSNRRPMHWTMLEWKRAAALRPNQARAVTWIGAVGVRLDGHSTWTASRLVQRIGALQRESITVAQGETNDRAFAG